MKTGSIVTAAKYPPFRRQKDSARISVEFFFFFKYPSHLPRSWLLEALHFHQPKIFTLIEVEFGWLVWGGGAEIEIIVTRRHRV